MITIDREHNVYRTEDGTEYPAVSAIVSPFEHIPVDEAALARGRAVHRACELVDGGGDGSGLQLSTVDPSLLGYVAAWEHFKGAVQPEFLAIEAPLVSRRYGYAGTPDRIAALRGQQHPNILDLKTGGSSPSYGVRLAAYGGLAKEAFPKSFRWLLHGLLVYLRADGTFSLEQVRLLDSWEAFRAMLAIYHWQRNGGMR